MTITSRKGLAAYATVVSALLFLYSLSFENDSVSKTTPASLTDYHPSFFVPKIPNDYPTRMMNRAFAPQNKDTVNSTTTTSSSCPVTSQVQVISTKQHHWILSSFDIHGRPKSIGGDEYYVTYQDHSMIISKSPTAVAMIQDLENGSYKLQFVTSPSLTQPLATTLSGRGVVNITLQYSCGVGHLAPPMKQHWRTGGAINVQYTVTNVTAPNLHWFQAPARGQVDFGTYNVVVAFGDSTMGQFAHRNVIWPGGNIGTPLTTDTVQHSRERKGVVFPSLITQITHQVENAFKEYGENIALVMGSGVWDLLADTSGQGTEFWNHRLALRRLISAIRTTFPSLDLYWKSVTAMHIHHVQQLDIERVFYMSTSRAYDLYRFQKEIIQESKVSFLDLYPATFLSAEHLLTLDGRHYSPEFNRIMLNWFYDKNRNSSASNE